MKEKKQNVILVNPFFKEAKSVVLTSLMPPLGLAYLASSLEVSGCNVVILDNNILQLSNL